MTEPLPGRVLEGGTSVRAIGREEEASLARALTPGTIVSFVPGQAEAVSVIAEAGTALAGLYALCDEAGLDPSFDAPLLDEVEALLERPGLEDEALVPLDTVPFVTIDGPGTRDLDQAVHLDADRHGFRVRYAIADASYYVRPGTKLFDAALARGASFYLPGLVVPMLPRTLSEGLISLGPEASKRALVFDSRVRRDGSVEGTRMYRARIKSRAKLSFGEVQAFLDAPSGHPFESMPFAASLRVLPDIGAARLADAAMRNVVRYRREETDIRLDETRTQFVVTRSLRHNVELWNEQLSLLCNAEGARFVLEGSEGAPYVEPIYRVHPAPEPARVEGLVRTIARIVALQGLDPERYAFDPKTSLSAFIARLPLEGPDARAAAAIERQAVLINTRSELTATPGAHHGVGAEPYARFSAPMRELVGIYVHAEACEKLEGRPLTSEVRGATLRDAVIASANRAKDRQRSLTELSTRLVLDRLFADDLASSDPVLRRGTVMGVAASKVYIALDEPALDLKMYIGDLGRVARARLFVDEAEASLCNDRGQTVIAVGDEIVFRCVGRDPVRNRFILLPTALPRLA